MERQKMISIIVPVYNVEKDLSTCIESILNQSYNNHEILLINDGSLDSSGTICDKYAELDKRIKVIHQKNQGVCEARNRGIELASGDFIMFVDSDDWLDKDYLQHFINNQKFDCIISGITTHEENKIRKESFEEIICNNNIEIGQCLSKHIQSMPFSSACVKLYSRELINKFGLKFNSMLTLGEDTYFFHNYIAHCKSIKIINNSGYNYRNNGFDYKKYKQNANKSLYAIRSLIDSYENLCKLFHFQNSNYYYYILNLYCKVFECYLYSIQNKEVVKKEIYTFLKDKHVLNYIDFRRKSTKWNYTFYLLNKYKITFIILLFAIQFKRFFNSKTIYNFPVH